MSRRSRRLRRQGARYDVALNPVLDLPLPGDDAAPHRAQRLTAVNLLRASGRVEDGIRRDAAVAARRMRRMFSVSDFVARPTPPEPSRRRATRVFSPMKLLRLMRPGRVLFCVRRKIRKEVLFAFKKAGYSGSARGRRGARGKYYRFSASSNYSC